MLRDEPLIAGETYHIFNRGAHKAEVFTNAEDFNRFLMLLYLCNSSEPVVMRDALRSGRMPLYNYPKGDARLVSIFAYSLMPNHFHIVARQETEKGMTIFMKKVLVAYSMYFNTKYEHSGVLFQGRFKSSHVGDEAYFRWIFSYVHLNPIDLVESGWKENGIRDAKRVRSFLQGYRQSSYPDYSGSRRPERNILEYEDAPDFLKTQNDFEDLLRWREEALPRSVLGKIT